MLVKNTIEKRRARVLKTRPQVRKTFPPEAELRALARSVIKRQLHPFIILQDNVILDGFRVPLLQQSLGRLPGAESGPSGFRSHRISL